MRLQVTHLRHNRNFPRGQDIINGAPGQRTSTLSSANRHTGTSRNREFATPTIPTFVATLQPRRAVYLRSWSRGYRRFDPFEAAIAAQIRRIADAADQQCAAAAQDNQDLQIIWCVSTARARSSTNLKLRP